jgi:hypothetical protein
MLNHRQSSFLLGFLLIIAGYFSGPAWASGYRPDVAEAIQKAAVIVEGDVVSAWDPQKMPGTAENEKDSFPREGRAYFMKVDRVFKGTVKAGDTIVVWDRHYASTAQYWVNVGAKNIMYLVDSEPSEFERKNLDFKTAKELFQPIRSLSIDKNDPNDKEYYEADAFLLNLLLLNPPQDLKAAYTDILKTSKNSNVIRHVIAEWPGKLNETEKPLFKEIGEKFKQDSIIVRDVMAKLAESGDTVTDEELIKRLKSDDLLVRSEAYRQINKTNITTVQDILFNCIVDDACEEGPTAIRALAEHSPDYFKSKLKASDLPFWKLIPALQALKITLASIGKDNLPESMLSLSPMVVYSAGDIYQGAKYANVHMIPALQKQDESEWKKALPLLSPLLSEPDSEKRRMAVAIIRTYGVILKKQDGKYVVEGSLSDTNPPPVEIKVETTQPTYKIGQPIKVKITETALSDGTWISRKGEFEWMWDYGNAGGGLFDIGKKSELPKEQFIELKKGQTFTSEVDLHWFIEQRPGAYKMHAIKAYPYDGDSIGLDAWTGAISSNVFEIKLEE